LYDKKGYLIYAKIAAFRKQLLKKNEEIIITDFGAGSRIFKGNTRKIKDIARHAGATQKRMRLLYRITTYFKPQHILDIGTSVGLSTYALAQNGAQVTTLEGCPETAKVATDAFAKAQAENITSIVGDFMSTIPELLKSKPTYDLIYFDGNHAFNATLSYANQLLPTVHNDTVWIFDDIHLHQEMSRAWEAIKQLPGVTVTVDAYWFGVAFFRKEQVKEDFYVRL